MILQSLPFADVSCLDVLSEDLTWQSTFINSTPTMTKELNHHAQTDALLLDLSKAFDAVPH